MQVRTYTSHNIQQLAVTLLNIQKVELLYSTLYDIPVYLWLINATPGQLQSSSLLLYAHLCEL